MITEKTSVSKKKQEDEIKEAVIGAGVILLLLYGLSKVSDSPIIKYSCSENPDYICNQNINGIYNSLQDCQNSCIARFETVEVIVSE